MEAHGRPKGLWVMYQNARTMLEMADFAAKNSDTVDRLLIETLRSDAMQIRVCVLMATRLSMGSPRLARVFGSTPSAPPPCIQAWLHGMTQLLQGKQPHDGSGLRRGHVVHLSFQNKKTPATAGGFVLLSLLYATPSNGDSLEETR